MYAKLVNCFGEPATGKSLSLPESFVRVLCKACLLLCASSPGSLKSEIGAGEAVSLAVISCGCLADYGEPGKNQQNSPNIGRGPRPTRASD